MRILSGIAVLCAAAILTTIAVWWWPAEQPIQAAATPMGHLRVETNPPATTVTIDGKFWAAPPEVPAGQHSIQLSAPGFETVAYKLDIKADQLITLRGNLEDITQPELALTAWPTLPNEGMPITILLDLADEGVGLEQLEFQVDSELLHTEMLDAIAAVDQMELQIAALTIGLHRLTAIATDSAGNSTVRDVYVDVQASGQPAPLVDVMDVALPKPGETLSTTTVVDVDAPLAAVPPAPSVPVVLTPVPKVTQATMYTETVIIPTYGYTSALDTTGSRPRLDANQMTPPQPQAYRAIILENDALRLTVLPELGGRLYQITDKATGQELLYNNPVIKPTRWGPEDMNWWLAVGGIEWAYPVHEHGYAWADTWEYDVVEDGEGATLTLSHADTPTDLQMDMVLQLPTEGRFFTIAPSVTNTGDTSAGTQMWINAAFPAGPGQQLDFPATQVNVHSAGESEGVQADQVLPWQPELADWGRWQTWFSAFAAPATEGVLAVQGDGKTVALQRSFSSAQAPGLKFFTWGAGGPTSEWEGSPYFEVWGGLTPDFNTYTNLKPGETRGWQEMWSIVDEQNE